jgi:hypothetical protein
MRRIRHAAGGAVAVALCVALAGCAKTLAFGTATKFALDVSQQADKNIDVSMGYDRAELAAIPAPKDRDGDANTDVYSVLGTFFVHYDNPFLPDHDPLRLNQFFATGGAARTAAQSPRFRAYFGHTAGVIEENRANSAPTFTDKVQEQLEGGRK